jgi:VWFA-related protein
MTRPSMVFGGVVICMWSATPLFAQTFKGTVEAVRIEASVIRDGKPVRGLTADDFVVTDNGITQRVAVTSLETAPLNVVLALDISSSVNGGTLERLVDGASVLAQSLREHDRLALITFAGGVERRVPLSEDHEQSIQSLKSMQGAGVTVLRDAIVAALQLKRDVDRPTLLMVFSDGQDTASWLSEQQVTDVVRRSSVVLHALEAKPVVVAPLQYGSARSSPNAGPSLSPNDSSSASDDTPSLLQTLSRLTGGRYWDARQQELGRSFQAAVDEMRTRYELVFYPQRPNPVGWHSLDVRVKGRRVAIAARAGYTVDR